jgi:acyl dehydratase
MSPTSTRCREPAFHERLGFVELARTRRGWHRAAL